MPSKVRKGTILLAWLQWWFAPEQLLQAQNIRVTSWTEVLPNAGRLAWSPTNNTIVYDKLLVDYYNLWQVAPDGGDDQCLTCSAADLPVLNKGNPVWSPNGNFVVFQVQVVSQGGPLANQIDFPGSGYNNDLWAMDSSGGGFWRLTNVGTGSGGVICPTCSRDGTKLAWGQRLSSDPTPWGSWELAVGDFTVSSTGSPSLTNIQYYTPGIVHGYYEPHGFSLDGQTLFFMGNLQPGMARLGMDIYAFIWPRVTLPTSQTRRTSGTNTRSRCHLPTEWFTCRQWTRAGRPRSSSATCGV